MTDTVAQFDCPTNQLVPAGDHGLLIGQAITAHTPRTPLLHLNHAYRRAADWCHLHSPAALG